MTQNICITLHCIPLCGLYPLLSEGYMPGLTREEIHVKGTTLPKEFLKAIFPT